jgi:cysteine synthase A
VLAGISSGATLAAAVKLARTAPVGSVLLCILGDTGERYLSTPLFDHVGAEMTEAEQVIAASTPSSRFGGGGGVPAAVAQQPSAGDAEAAAKLQALISDAPVVLFALEWCEFCWSLRKLLDAVGVPYKDVALDAAALQSGDLGLRLRRALAERTGMPTVPQLFVGGEPIGGCMDAFAAFRSGALRRDLESAGVGMAPPPGLVPESFLPGWLLVKPQIPQASA